MDKETALKITNLGKKYTIGVQKDGTLRSTLANAFKSSAKKGEEFWALRNVSFEIPKGEVVGIIGKNGAGKSTLLKLISQITKPTEGKIEINGRVASLLEVGTGFHPELTGRENIFLNGTILGMSRKEVKAKFDEIVAFSGIEKFIDTPVKHYSSGMYVRLAFAVAAHLEPEILIIDEVLAVGDAEFQKKCLGKMKDIAGSGRTVLFVSHQISSVRKLCNTGILLNNGGIKVTGNIDKVIDIYQHQDQNNSNYIAKDLNKEIYVAEAYLQNNQFNFMNEEDVLFNFKIKYNNLTNKSVYLHIRIMDNQENVIGSSEIMISTNKQNYTYTLKRNTLCKGIYKLNCILYQPGVTQYDNVSECCNFEILDNNRQFSHLETFDIGNIYLPNDWN
jgi:lipopolysaccharide transport system ATP-binding protein